MRRDLAGLLIYLALKKTKKKAVNNWTTWYYQNIWTKWVILVKILFWSL